MSSTCHIVLPRGHRVFHLRHVVTLSHSQTPPLHPGPRESLTNQPCRPTGRDPPGHFTRDQAPQISTYLPFFPPRTNQTRKVSSSGIWLPGSFPAAKSGLH